MTDTQAQSCPPWRTTAEGAFAERRLSSLRKPKPDRLLAAQFRSKFMPIAQTAQWRVLAMIPPLGGARVNGEFVPDAVVIQTPASHFGYLRSAKAMAHCGQV